MAADPFSDPNLFEEFDKASGPNDRILLQKIQDGIQSSNAQFHTNGHGLDGGETKESTVEFSLESDASDNDDFIADDETENGTKSGVCDGGSNAKKLEKQIQKLKLEIENLKQINIRKQKCARMLNPQKCNAGDGGPGLEVLFLHNAFARKHKRDIELFIANLYHRSSAQELLPELRIPPNTISLIDDIPIAFPESNLAKIQANSVLSCCHFYGEFVVDSMGWPLVDWTPSLTDGWEVPKYEQIWWESLPMNEEEDEGPKVSKRPKASCFNCAGDHSMASCPNDRDQQAINANRQIFQAEMEKFQASNPGYKSNRYHEEEEMGHSNYIPGIISQELRDAMGLSASELPPYIYQMRQLGYPPGHLENAKNTNTLEIFGNDGKAVIKQESMEDGEVDEDVKRVEYDVEKLISYPGFNIPVPEGVRDDHERLGVLAMQPQHSKEVLAVYLTPQKVSAGSKRHLSRDEGSASKRARVASQNSVDMDMSASDLDESIVHTRSETPTLEELERQRKILQAQLDSGDSGLSNGEEMQLIVLDSLEDEETDTDAKSPLSDFKEPQPPSHPRLHMIAPGTPGASTPPPIPLDTPPTKPPLPDSTPPPTPPISRLFSQEAEMHTPEGRARPVTTPSSGGSLSVAFGTPVRKDKMEQSPSNQLPAPDKWSLGISDHIPFENLPGATGSYDKMSKILSIARKHKTGDT